LLESVSIAARATPRRAAACRARTGRFGAALSPVLAHNSRRRGDPVGSGRPKEAVLQSEQQLRAIFNQAAVGIALAGMDGRFIELNRKFAEILGYSEPELRALTFTELTHPDDRGITSESVRQLLAGDIPEYTLEKRYLRKDGDVVWSLTTVTLMRDQHGQPQRFIGVIEDITRRKEAEAALREETRILELLNETGKLLASELDLKSLLQAVTDAATQLSGAQFGSFFYNTTDENGDAFLLYTLSGAPREAFDTFGKPRATALFGPTFRGEAPIRIADVLKDARYATMGPHHGMPPGHLPVRSYLAVPVKSRSGEVIGGLFFGHSQVGVFTERAERLIAGVAAQAGIAVDNARLYDVAQRAAEERKALLESERAARTAAERLSEVKDEFLATLSHELRTPLNAILGWAQVLRAGRKGEADYLRGLETIERNARVQTQLIEDLLDMSRITAGKIRLDVQHVDAIALIDVAAETVKPAADAKNIRIERDYDRTLTSMSGDPARLQQVIWNLLSNAIKFTPHGGQVRIALNRAGGNVEIVVSDTGIGIKPEFLPHLFERFRQGDSSSTRRFGGLGLGLSIVKSLVELHGGTVWADSPGEGLGTTVKMLIPLVVPHAVFEDAGISTARPLDLSVVSELAGLKLLVVEDQADARELIQRVLEDSGAEVLTAANAADALALVRTAQPDILVSDIGMPEGDGFDLLRSLRALGAEHGGNIPAIAVTAFARSEDRTRALRAGFLAHVAKPLDAAELVATVASVAGRLTDRSLESTSGSG
jgi:PAS domain S-box-containing protein